MFKCTAVTPERVVFERDAVSLVAPGELGYLGILSDHAPLITVLVPGKLKLTEVSGNTSFYFVSGGFLEVSGNVATILADAIEAPEEIDVERAKQAEQRARDRLRQLDPNIDRARAEAALRRAVVRQQVAQLREGIT